MKKILVFVSGFPPGYRFGGPAKSILNMVNALGSDFEFSIVTSDRDAGDDLAYSGITVDQWVQAYGARVLYCSPARMTLDSVSSLLRETPHDLLYLNSFFAPRFSIFPLMARRFSGLPRVPTVLAPRGEFSIGALRLKSWKKCAYIATGEVLGLFRGLKWHASTELEAADIRKRLGVEEDSVFVASNLLSTTSVASPYHRARAPGEPLRVVFLSRISPKKNLDFALEVLSGTNLPMTFSIVGPEEDAAYSARCRALADRLPDTIRVEWVGARPPEAVPQTMADHDLLFLPTHGENFGHVIAEALSAGTPVLLSDTTPWRELEAAGVGRDLPLGDVGRFREALRVAWHQSPNEVAKMRERAATFVRNRQQDGAVVEANRALFERALSSR